ncbi:ribosomal protein L5 domain-containing protein [Flagelloscypha sp. PMI_526]|nr:ribosomal protein L5 domain-containing protein [Flagelloscypha sp. PMI_526]
MSCLENICMSIPAPDALSVENASSKVWDAEILLNNSIASLLWHLVQSEGLGARSGELAGTLPPLRFQNLKIYPRKRLRRDPKTWLPIPHVNVKVRDFAPCRLEDHYHTTLKDDLMYMNYIHEHGVRPPRKLGRPTYDPEDPFTKGRKNLPIDWNKFGERKPPQNTADNVLRLEKVHLHIMEKSAYVNKSNLLGPIMCLRALSGETEAGGGKHGPKGVEITRGRTTIQGWVRPKAPIGVKVELQGAAMWDFIGTLTEFVLPRMRDFNGFVMPSASTSMKTVSSASGVVSIGLPPTAMGFFPQIEVNLEMYPKMYGLYIHFVTNVKGKGAQEQARALVSGLQVPFSIPQILQKLVIGHPLSSSLHEVTVGWKECSDQVTAAEGLKKFNSREPGRMHE